MNRALPTAQQALRVSFAHGAMIRHSYRNAVKVGKFDANKLVIVCNGVEYTSLSTFAKAHKFEHVGRSMGTNGWDECEYYTEADGWKSTYGVRPLPE
jgi:hypothetical protein